MASKPGFFVYYYQLFKLQLHLIFVLVPCNLLWRFMQFGSRHNFKLSSVHLKNILVTFTGFSGKSLQLKLRLENFPSTFIVTIFVGSYVELNKQGFHGLSQLQL